MQRNRTFLMYIFCFFLGFVVSCRPSPIPQETGQDKVSISSLLVLPVDPVLSVKTDISEEKLNELRQGALIMDELLKSYLTTHSPPKLTLLEESQFESYIGDRSGSRLALGVMIAKEMGHDAVLSLRLSRFSERRGTKYSANSPASLAFEYRLIDVRSGTGLCGSTFDASQEALFDNLFFFSARKSLRWLPIREFAADALQENLDGCPVLQPSQPR